MAEASPGISSDGHATVLMVKIGLEFCSSETDAKRRSIHSSERNIKTVRDSAITLFKRNDNLQNCLKKIHTLKLARVTNIITEGCGGISFECLLNTGKEVDALKNEVHNKTLQTYIVQMVQQEIATFNWYKLRLDIAIIEDEKERAKQSYKPSTRLGSELVTVHNERKMMKQTMAQTHVEPLVICLHTTYSLQILETAPDTTAVVKSTLLELQDIESLNNYFKNKDEFRGFRIQEIEPDKERENSVNVRIATYNSAEVDSLVNLLENGQLEKEFENYVKATVFGVSHIGFAIEVKPSEIEHWRNVFITRTKKPLPSQRPPLKPKPTEEQPSKKTANVYAVIQKLFCVFVPSDQVTNIRTVKIKTLQGPSSITEKINNKELVEHSQIKRLWTLRVTLPANMSLNFNYKYCVTGVQSNLSSSLRSSFDFSETEDIVPENLSRTCLDFRTERDVFGNSEHLEDGVLGHFKHILCDADDTDINDSFYEINSLKEVEKLSIDRKEKIIKELIKGGNLTTPLKSLCFLGMLAVMTTKYELDLQVSKNLLIGISKSKMISMEKSLKKSILKVVLGICSSMKESSFIHFITYAFPFFDEEIMLEIFNNCENYKLKKSSDWIWEPHQKVSWEGRIIECINIICNRAISERKPECMELLQKLLSCLPAQQTMMCINQIQVEFKEYSEFSQDIQNLSASVADKYEHQLSEYAQNGDAYGIEKMWKNMDSQSRLSFLTKVEDSLLLCFEEKFLKYNSRIPCETLLSMCKQYDILFREEKQQSKLFNKLYRSTNDRCQDLFQQLIELPGFCEENSQSSKAFVVGWYESVLSKIKLSWGSEGTQIKLMYAKLGSVMENSGLIQANHELQNILSDLTYSFMLNDINIDQAISMIHCMWLNDKAEEWFLKHLEKLIKSQREAAKKLGKKLTQERGYTLEVNKSAMANLVVTLMDVEGSECSSLSLEDAVCHMVCNAYFWISSLTVQGRAMKVVKDSNIFRITLKRLLDFKEHLSEKRYSKRTFDIFRGKENDLFRLYERIVPSSEKLDALWKSCKFNYEENLKMLEDTVKNVKEIERLKEYAGDSFSETCSIVGLYIEEKIDELSTGLIDLVEVLEFDVFRKSKDPNFHQKCTWLCPLVKSHVFTNINRDILKSFLSVRAKGSDYSDETKESFHIKLLDTFVGYLFKEGQQRYKDVWEPFVEGNDVEVDEVLKCFRSAVGRNEVKLAETQLSRKLNEDMKSALMNLLNYKEYKNKIFIIKSALDTFEIDQYHSSEFMKYFDIILKMSKLSLLTVSPVLKYLYAIADDVDDSMKEVLSVLRKTEKSIELIHFLRREIDVDMGNLVDSVEDYSDQNVSLSTVSSLIEVQGFLKPLLQCNHLNDIPKFLSVFKAIHQSKRIQQIDSKFLDCFDNIFGIKFLYDNMANREEKTREIINNIIEQGIFHFSLVNGFCTVDVSYSLSKTKVTHSASKLSDLKSQALLIMNTEKKDRLMHLSDRIKPCNFQYFTRVVDQAFGIHELCTDLHLSGHDQYKCFQENVTCKNLYQILKKLHVDYTEWEDMLRKTRDSYPFMNYVYGLQIHKLYDCFILLTTDIYVLPILQFICPAVSINEIKAIIKVESSNKRSVIPIKANALKVIAEKIKQVCGLVEPVVIPFPLERKNFKMKDYVQKGRMYVARLQTDSDSVTRVMLSLYLNTTSNIPCANQVLFCDKDTQWDEIFLLLRRCENENKSKNSLFCIAYIEFLPTEIRNLLAMELHNMKNNPNTLLAIIIRCDSDNSFLNRFTEHVMNPDSFSEPQVRECLQSVCKYVEVFTSDSAGLGKTETIKEKAYDEGKQMISFHISGPFNKKIIVQRLLSLELKKTDFLHIDIGPTLNSVELDLFLFQLLFFKIVSAGTTLCSLQTEYVCIELANSFDGYLERDMPHIALFRRRHLCWKGFSNYKISSEITSDVQVVCQYLQRFENNELDRADIYFSGQQKSQALEPNTCQNLLANCFGSSSGLTFPQINIFISVLAQQLKRLSMSTFFRTKNLASGILPQNTNIEVKSTLVKALIDISKTFAIKSIHAARKSQMMTRQKLAEKDSFGNELPEMEPIDNVQGIIKWEDSNHLMLLFQNKDKETISALYKDLQRVPKFITKLLEIQGQKQLRDLDDMSQTEQQNLVFAIARSGQSPIDPDIAERLAKSYVLTTDNILKMVLIWLRIQARIPVIVMGETGCGKTSLIRYLSKTCKSNLEVFNVHAGIDDKKIVSFVQEINSKALKTIKNPIWIFFDEINTTDSIGLLTDIICHRKVNERELAPNLVLLAACNPYKIRNKYSMKTPGLQGKLKSDKLSHLVYRVHPIPEALIEYIWDFGSLSATDERQYIKRIVQNNDKILTDRTQDLFVALISESQCFVRNEEKSSYCVSLRDVNRCQRLYQWFMCTYFELKNSSCDSYCQSIKAMILSLAHCYYCRFQFMEVRQRYLEKMSDIIIQNGYDLTKENIENIIMKEQCEILSEMNLPAGTAKNTALQENVFMILVSALNKLPLFIVGKPGCSKSLSIQLIKSNMRGKDSKSNFFAKLPRVMCVSFQGSESSTSDGIIKVFERAKEIQSSENILPLVILDEIGLAEVSQFNPLKVLHSLLEPVDRDTLDVAVVGISNWALDAAKMNRAIHLCRPDMDYADVYKTGLSIVESFTSNVIDNDIDEFETARPVLSDSKKRCLEAIAKAYTEYIQRQSFQNFHGLRDFYSLIKYFSRNWFCKNDIPSKAVPDIINSGLCRNFGGKKSELELAKEIFQIKMKDCICMSGIQKIPVYELIKCNVMDTNSRHLMLLSNGDAILNILTQLLDDIDREYVTIVGSKFEDDQNDDYNYRNLSQIILCMEQGKVLILKDLDSIYGSLYDMLNQNYTEFAKKRYCRVALGEYSNPMCYVKDEFKCIVLVEESDLFKSDPPFLNRFEKQQFSYADLLPKELSEPQKNLESFCTQICQNEGINKDASLKNFIPIAGDDMLISLLLQQTSECPNLSIEEMEESCLLKLLHIFTPESLLKVNESELSKTEIVRRRNILSRFLALPVHNGLSDFLEHFYRPKSNHSLKAQKRENGEKTLVVSSDFEKPIEIGRISENNSTDFSIPQSPEKLDSRIETSEEVSGCSIPELRISSKQMSKKLVVFTHSNIHFSIELDRADVVRISHFKSKKSIETTIDDFLKSEKDFLVIQFDIRFDFKHLLLVKTIIDTNVNKLYIKDSSGGKNIIFVLHLSRSNVEEVDLGRKLNFLSGWNFVYLDTLEKPKINLTNLIGKNIHEIILASKDELPEKIKKKLFWAFTRISYARSKLRKVQDLNSIVETIQNIPELLELLAQRICEWTSIDDMSMSLVPKIASDLHALYLSSSLIGAICSNVEDCIGNQLAKMVFVLEEIGAFDCMFSSNIKGKKWNLWTKLFQNEQIFNIENVPDPEGPCCFIVQRTVNGFKTPFITHFFHQIESLKQDFLLISKQFMDDNDIDTVGELSALELNNLMESFRVQILGKINELTCFDFESQRNDYIEDFFVNVSGLYSCRLNQEKKLEVLQWIMSKYCRIPEAFKETVVVLHTTFWLFQMHILAILRLIDVAVNTFSVSLDLLLLKTPTCEDRTTDETEESLASVFSSLIDYIFRLNIPSSSVLQHKSLSIWQRNVNGLFCISGLLGVDDPLEHILRFCHDLTVILLLPYSFDRNILQVIGDALTDKHSRLESSATFETFIDVLRKIREKHHHVPMEALQRTLCMYVNRCFAVDSDQATTLTISMLQVNMENQDFDQKLTSVGPTLGLALRHLHSKNNSIFLMLISSTYEIGKNTLLENCKLFRIIDQCLKNERIGKTLAGIVCYLLQRDIYSKLMEGNDQYSTAYIVKDEAIQLLMKASDVMYADHEVNLRKVAAISFCRTYISKFVVSKDVLHKNENVCAAVNSMLNKHKSSHSNGIIEYFLRCIENGNGTFALRYSCNNLSDVINICKHFYSINTECDIDIHPLVPHVSDIFKQFKHELQSLDQVECEEIMTKFSKKREICLSSLTLLHSNYLRKVNPNIAVAVNRPMVEKALKIAKITLTDLNCECVIPFVQCLAGKSDLRISLLEVSFMAENFHLISVISQFICLVISQCSDDNIWKQLICNPDTAVETNIPFEKRILKIHACNTAETCYNCRHRIMSEFNECPVCETEFAIKRIKEKKTEEPEVCRIVSILIDFLICSCLLSALGTSIEDTNHNKATQSIRKAMNIPHQHHTDLFLENRIEDHWNHLKRYFATDNSGLCRLFQVIFIETMHLFKNDCRMRDENEWSHFKVNFTSEISRIVINQMECMKSIWSKMRNALSINLEDCLEIQLNYPGTVMKDDITKSQDQSLFLRFSNPSPENLFASMHFLPFDRKLPLLRLVFENLEWLRLPLFLPPFISWNSAFLKCARFRLKKCDLETMTVTQFIENLNGENDRHLLNRRFAELKKTINSLKRLTSNLEDNVSFGLLDTLGDNNLLKDYVILERNSLMYLIIEELTMIQNKFLDKVLEISCMSSTNDSYNCPDTSFVLKRSNAAAIQAIDLMNITRKDVISFEFGRILMYSQCGTSMSDINTIYYDYYTTQLEIAYMLHGKAYIIIPKEIPSVDFADDLYRNSALLLESIKDICDQRPLPAVTESYLKRVCDANPSICQSLITIIGILLAAMTQSSETHSEKPLSDFIDEWKSGFPEGSIYEVLLSAECQLNLCNIVPLYKFFEETNGGMLINSISQYYRVGIEEDDRKFITSQSKCNFHMIRHLFKAMKILLHRCSFLRQTASNSLRPSRQQRLCDLLNERSFWCDGCEHCNTDDNYIEKCIKCIPARLAVKQFYSTIFSIKENVQKSVKPETPKYTTNIATKRQTSRKKKKLDDMIKMGDGQNLLDGCY